MTGHSFRGPSPSRSVFCEFTTRRGVLSLVLAECGAESAPGDLGTTEALAERECPEQTTRTGGGMTTDTTETVSIELSPAQVGQVLREASGMGGMPWLLSQLEGLGEVADALRRERNQYLSRSLLLGIVTLAAFQVEGRELGIGDVARMLNIHPSTTHRYISTLLAAGLLEQHPSTRRYRLAQ
jgi:IclR-like helix-turn-helix domain-containing protein